MGASKKAKVQNILFPSQKRAYDAARNAGQGKPILHPPHKKGERRHFRPTYKNGEIIKDGKTLQRCTTTKNAVAFVGPKQSPNDLTDNLPRIALLSECGRGEDG